MEDLNAFTIKTRALLEKGQPFFFLVDFDCCHWEVQPFSEAADQHIHFCINGISNGDSGCRPFAGKHPTLTLDPVSKKMYKKAFDTVMEHIHHGNSFLLNLSFPTPLKTDLQLGEIFEMAHAKYKLLYKNEFVCFSPESFIKIQGDTIATYPMKGTINADLPDAEHRLLTNQKEQQEHATIVDLLRNDLSMVAKEVTVTKFRYLERIKTPQGNLLQSSSEIRGTLPSDWRSNFGELMASLLPAGSICGAPKAKTVAIINAVEPEPRGFYTGVFGVFDGENIDSGVAIRFIEQTIDGLRYRSGGGLTYLSHWADEYDELLRKIYVPIG